MCCHSFNVMSHLYFQNVPLHQVIYCTTLAPNKMLLTNQIYSSLIKNIQITNNRVLKQVFFVTLLDLHGEVENETFSLQLGLKTLLDR